MPKPVGGAAAAAAEAALKSDSVSSVGAVSATVAPFGSITTAMEEKDGLNKIMVEILEGPPVKYAGPWARVTAGATSSVQLAQFQYARPTVLVELPCHPNKLHAAYEYAQAWADERLAAAVSEIQEAVG